MYWTNIACYKEQKIIKIQGNSSKSQGYAWGSPGLIPASHDPLMMEPVAALNTARCGLKAKK